MKKGDDMKITAMIFGILVIFYILYRYYIKTASEETSKEGVFRFCMINVLIFYMLDSIYDSYVRFVFSILAFGILWLIGIRPIDKKKDLNKDLKSAGNFLIVASIITTIAQVLGILFTLDNETIYSFDRAHINIILVLLIILNAVVRFLMDKKLISSCIKTSSQKKIFISAEIISVLIFTGFLIFNIVNVDQFVFYHR